MMKKHLKAILPLPVRRVLRGSLHYVQRIGRWGIILWQVRGASWGDQWVLLRSALTSPVLSLKGVMEWQDPILLEDVEVVVRGVGRFQLRKRCDDLWHVLPWRESKLFQFWRTHVVAGDVVIDAGANIGVYTVLASRLVGRKGKVIAVEMMPDTAERLEHNLRLNGIKNVMVVRKALSDRAGDTVTAEVVPGKFGQASISLGKVADKVNRIEVETVTLDELTRDIGLVRLMKMDLEGAELQALFGATETLKQKTSYIMYESWGRSRKNENQVDNALEAMGFRLKRLDGNNWVASKTLSGKGI